MPHLRAPVPESRPVKGRPRRASPLAMAATVVAAIALAAAVLYLFFGAQNRWNGAQPDGAARVLRVEIKRDFKNAVLSLEIEFQNDTAEEVTLIPPFAVLLDAENQPVSLFTLGPKTTPPPVPPGEKKTTRVRYWLEPGQLAGPLRLKIGEQSIVLKSPAAFTLTDIPNQDTAVLRNPDW